MEYDEESYRLMDDALSVLNRAMDYIGMAAKSGVTDDKIAELVDAMKDIPAVCRNAVGRAADEYGSRRLRHAIDDGTRIMNEIERQYAEPKPMGVAERLKTAWVLVTQG
jgi:hypothetical protein